MTPSGKPNVLFLFTDDQRFDTLAAPGNEHVRTPNLDKLAARGTSFTRAHIMGGTSGAVCMPSRAMLHTGRSLFHIEGRGQTIPAEHTTMGECFRAAGYQTFGAGKWHNGRESYARSFTDGDEIMFGGMADHWNMPAYHYDPSGRYESVLPYCVDALSSNVVNHRAADHVAAGEHSTDLLAAATETFLRNRSTDRPFLAYVSFLAPHDPRTMPQEFLDMYDPEEIELPANFAGAHPFDNGELKVRDEKLEDWPRTPEAVRRHIAEYYAMISHVDAAVGRILQALKDAGEDDNTIIVFAGDNGLAVGQHGLMGKQSLYEHSIRVPLMFAGPGVPAGQRREQFVYLHDALPTLCDLCGLDAPPSAESMSLAPALADPAAETRATLMFAYRHLQRGVKDERYKLIEYVVDGRRRTQLFDLDEDPCETRDLSGEADQTERIEALRGELSRWRDEVDDPGGVGEESSFWAGYERS
ncbi:MAG: sulfatase-like hydrolase/transferase [Planctomycetota bacterium]